MAALTFEAALAGLLHDIGLLALRAGMAPPQPWDRAQREEFGQAHGPLSAAACSHLPAQWQPVLAEAAHHHRPHTRLARLVAIAEALATGEPEVDEDGGPSHLLSIFSRLTVAGQGAGHDGLYLPLLPLALQREALFPGPPGDGKAGHAALWRGLQARLAGLQRVYSAPEADGLAYLGNLLHLLRQYTWCVPAGADVSLYDHSRITAALAVCLSGCSDAGLQALAQRPAESDTLVALLVVGDISGVQDFIYTITPRGAASALRGRSLYLQLLADAVASYVLSRLGLPPTNLLYSSGGRFSLLVPPAAAAELPEIQRYVARVLLAHHAGALYMALGHAPLPASSFYQGRFARPWAELSAALRRSKDRRFSELGAELHPSLFVPWRDQGSEERECQVCHLEHPGCRQEGELRKCPACRALEEELGERLRQARYLCIDEVAPSFRSGEPAGTPQEVFAAFGMRVRLLDELPPPAGPGVERRQLLAHDDEAAQALEPAPRCVVGRRFLVNVTPVGPHGVGRTGDLVAASRGVKRLGVLRLDVDNLGAAFSTGLGRRATLARVAALSHAINLYFEGWVEVLAREYNPEGAGHRAYSIYSGGDDLFFVGSWDAMADLARRIRADFAEYTGHHPGLHLSGGLALVTERYPLYQAAHDAGEAEEEAKGLPGKNSFCFLGQALPWPTVERAAALAARLCRLLEARKASRSLLRLLIDTQTAYEEARLRALREGGGHTVTGQPQGYYGPWVPRAQYALARLKELHRGAAREIDELVELMREDDYRAVAWVGLAARWAELLTRADSGGEEKGA